MLLQDGRQGSQWETFVISIFQQDPPPLPSFTPSHPGSSTGAQVPATNKGSSLPPPPPVGRDAVWPGATVDARCLSQASGNGPLSPAGTTLNLIPLSSMGFPANWRVLCGHAAKILHDVSRAPRCLDSPIRRSAGKCQARLCPGRNLFACCLTSSCCCRNG